MKLGIFYTENDDHLLIAIHHLVIDGVSWRILLEDFKHVYEALANGEEPQLPPKTNSYIAWSRMLNDASTAEKFASERDYWREEERRSAQLRHSDQAACPCAMTVETLPNSIAR